MAESKMETTPLAAANSELAIKIHRELAKEQKNVFFSPLSISTALAMLFHGARGQTAAEMRSTLGYEAANLPSKDVSSSFGQLMEALKDGSESYTLSCANSLLSEKQFTVKEQYKTDLQEFYKAVAKEVDFANELQRVVDEINEYVKENTKGMIPKLLETLDPSTVLVLLNAVYFKGSWERKFDQSATYQQPFFNKGLESSAKEVPMMHLTKSFPFSEKQTFQALQLPYKGGEIAMLLLLPKARNGLKALEATIGPNFVADVKKDMHKQKVIISLPKFRMEYSKSLKDTFQSIGMNRVFSRGAELDGISDSRDLAVSEIIHKAVLEVNEEGSEAAAATAIAVAMCCLTFDPEFTADHPFLFVIYNTVTNFILFMGRVEEL